MFSGFSPVSHTARKAPGNGRLIKLCRYWIPQKTGKGDALRKEKALLHTFVAGQNYGVRRDATRRFRFAENNKGNR